MWGMDILGPLPKALGAIKYLLVTIGYFTKWIEARTLRDIVASEVKKFTLIHLKGLGIINSTPLFNYSEATRSNKR